MIKLLWDSGFEKKLQKYIVKHPEDSEKIKLKLKKFEEECVLT